MIVRKARFRDLNTILDLQVDSFGLILVPKYLIIVNRLTGIPYYLLYDVHRGHLVGYIALLKRSSDIYLASVAIKQTYQSQGYGKRVLEHLIAMGHAENKSTASFHTSVDNTGMLALAERYGFVEVDIIKDYYTRGYLDGDAVKMVKGLGHPGTP